MIPKEQRIRFSAELPMFSTNSGSTIRSSITRLFVRDFTSVARVDMRPVHPTIIEFHRAFAFISMRLSERLIALLDLIQMRRNTDRDRVITTPANRAQDRQKQHVVERLTGCPCDHLSLD